MMTMGTTDEDKMAQHASDEQHSDGSAPTATREGAPMRPGQQQEGQLNHVSPIIKEDKGHLAPDGGPFGTTARATPPLQTADRHMRTIDEGGGDDDDLDLLCSPPPLPPQPPHPPPTFRHAWHPTQGRVGTWTCALCGNVANTGYLEPPSLEGCRGWSVVVQGMGEGHRLVRYTPIQSHEHLPIVYACDLCHRASSSKPVFEQPCTATTSRSRTTAFRRLEAGLHPHSRKGGEMAYQAGSWLHIHPRRKIAYRNEGATPAAPDMPTAGGQPTAG